MSGPKHKMESKITDQRERSRAPVDGTSELFVFLKTASQAPVAEERVIVVLPDGSAKFAKTNAEGLAQFPSLPFPRKSVCYVVVPDILETWVRVQSEDKEEDARAELEMVFVLKAGKGKGRGKATKIGQPGAERAPLAALRSRDKDEIDDRVHSVAGKAYRTGDLTKYYVESQTVGQGARKGYTIVLDRLTQSQKLDHFLWAFQTYPVGYNMGVHAYRYRTEGDRRRWYNGATAFCNGLVNLFLGYWFNYNGAFEKSGSNFTFLQVMENDSAKYVVSGIGSYRGYRELWDRVLKPQEGTVTSSDLLKKTVDGVSKRFEYVDAAKGEADRWWDSAAHRPTGDMRGQFGFLNVYSVWQPKTGVDSHGGLFHNDGQKILKIAADSDKVRVGVPEDRINQRESKPYRLRIWRLVDLASGGAIRSQGGKLAAPDSVLESEKGPIISRLPNSVPRFVERG